MMREAKQAFNLMLSNIMLFKRSRGVRSSLVVQWLGLCGLTEEGQGFDPDPKLRSHQLQGTAKKNRAD